MSCPRTGEPIARTSGDPTDPSIQSGVDWYSTGDPTFRRPTPQWWVDDEKIYGPDGFEAPMTLSVPGRANRGNAAQAVAAAVAFEPVDDGGLGVGDVHAVQEAGVHCGAVADECGVGDTVR